MPDSALDSLIRHLNDYIDDHENIKAPEGVCDSWSPFLLAKRLKNCLRRPCAVALDNIEKYLRREVEVYTPMRDLVDKLRDELDSLGRAALCWKRWEYIQGQLGEELVNKLERLIKTELFSREPNTSAERLNFGRGRPDEWTALLARVDLQCRFWYELLRLDELVERADLSDPALAEAEKNGPRPTDLMEIHNRLKETAARLSKPLPALPLGQGQPQPETNIYLHYMDQNRFKPYEKICLALPHVSGFYSICNKIDDQNGTRHGYTNPETGSLAAMNIPQYGGNFRFGAMLAEENYKQSIDALVNQYGPRTMYIIAMPEYYHPRYHTHDYNIGHIYQLLKNHDLIIISGLEGQKAGRNGRPLSQSLMERSEAMMVYSPGSESYIVNHGQFAVFLDTPLGSIGISTYRSLSSLGTFKDGLKFVLENICRELELSYLFVCSMTDKEKIRYESICRWLASDLAPRLGETRLVLTDHDRYDSGAPPYDNYSKMYSQGGLMDDHERVDYTLDGCALFSKVFMV